MYSTLICRERERQHQREELWNRVENLAARSPGYELIQKLANEFNNVPNSPEQDEDINLDNLEQEAQEVSFVILLSSLVRWLQKEFIEMLNYCQLFINTRLCCFEILICFFLYMPCSQFGGVSILLNLR